MAKEYSGDRPTALYTSAVTDTPSNLAGAPPTEPPVDGPILALDSGSPVVSVALGTAGDVWGSRSVAQASSSEALLGLVDELLAEHRLVARDLSGVVGARGPGSFTGLRVGLATLLGLHQALAVPAAAVPTLEILAAWTAEGAAGTIVAAVDALRGEWFVQTFEDGEPPRATGAPRCVAARAIDELAPCRVVGFGVGALGGPGVDARPVDTLAPAIVRLAAWRPLEWRPADLLDPLYLRQPAVSRPA